MMTAVVYDGTLPEGVLIADRTNPWIEVDGEPVDWERWSLANLDKLDFDGCEEGCGAGGTPLAGVIAPMDTVIGVQRCDTCDVFPGDLEAAQALAATVGGVVMFEPMSDSEGVLV